MIAATLLLFFWPWGNDLYALPKLALVCALLLWWAWSPRREHTLNPARAWKAWGAVIAVVMLSAIYSQDPAYSLAGIAHARGLGLFEWLVCALLFSYGVNARIGRFDAALLLAGMLTALSALLEWAAYIVGALPLHPVNGARASVTQGSPVFLGEMLVIVFPFAWKRSGVLTLPFVAAACAAQSRSAVAAMIVMAVYLNWRRK